MQSSSIGNADTQSIAQVNNLIYSWQRQNPGILLMLSSFSTTKLSFNMKKACKNLEISKHMGILSARASLNDS